MNNVNYNIKDIQKIALCENLIGSIPFPVAKKMAGIKFIHTNRMFKSSFQKAQAYKNTTKSFNSTYDKISELLSSPKAYVTNTYNLLKKCADNNAIYAEISVSPYRMMSKHDECSYDTYKNNLSAMQLAIKMANEDFGIEASIIEMDDIVGWNKNTNSPKKIWKTLCSGANRIASTQIVASNNIPIQSLIENSILVEVCPSKDIAFIKDITIENHPIRKLYESGVKIAITSENGGILNTNIGKEYETAAKNFNFTNAELIDISLCAIEASSANTAAKNRLSKRIYDQITNEDIKEFKELALKSKNDILANRLLDRAKGKIYE